MVWRRRLGRYGAGWACATPMGRARAELQATVRGSRPGFALAQPTPLAARVGTRWRTQ